MIEDHVSREDYDIEDQVSRVKHDRMSATDLAEKDVSAGIALGRVGAINVAG